MPNDTTGSVQVIDTWHCDRANVIAVTAMPTADGVLLFDCGPESTYERVRAGLQECDLDPAAVRHVFLSHIHLDHAGAAWRFAEAGATIYVHPRGATHLADPSKLIDSAAKIFGDQMERLWGKIAGVRPERITVANDGDTFHIGDVRVQAIATPGHASHHHVYQWDDNLFGGDVAGVRIRGGPPIPPLVPPELDVEAWRQSIQRLREVRAARLYLPHFGLFADDLPRHFDVLEERLQRWSEWFRGRIVNGATSETLVAPFAAYQTDELRHGGADEAGLIEYESADPSFMAVTAALRYWHKYHAIG